MSGDENKFTTWRDVRGEIFTPEEIAESDLRVALSGELMKLRDAGEISAGDIERIESKKENTIDDYLKILLSHGKTLAIVPLE